MPNRVPKSVLLVAAAAVCFLALLLGTGSHHFEPLISAAGADPMRSALGAHVAIADLDGDRNPDLATIEIESQRFARADYFIRVQLSAGTQSGIRLDGPVGGLRLAARDVNGDDTLDLIISSISDAHVVAVLLNDGHGGFSVANGAEYALAKESQVFLCQRAGTVADRITLAQPRSTFYAVCAGVSAGFATPSSHQVKANERLAASLSANDVTRGRSPPQLIIFA